jgi:hypothetical protein
MVQALPEPLTQVVAVVVPGRAVAVQLVTTVGPALLFCAYRKAQWFLRERVTQ